ncbi:MAG: DMT family transporter [Spirochaetes bacterium]|nr:DMT family transporter [Spirochaetota bacterium]
MKRQIVPELMLVLCTVIWGGTFLAVKVALSSASPWLIVSLRFALAGLIFVPFFLRSSQSIDRRSLLHGLILGILLMAGFGLQTLGLQFVSPSRSAFLTETLALIVPLLSFFIQRKLPTRYNLAGAALVVGGLFLITSPGGLFAPNRGDYLTLGCAIAFSVYIILVDIWSTPTNALALSLVQSFVVAVASLPFVFLEGIRLAQNFSFVLALLYLAIPGTFVVILLQMRYQPLATPARAGVIFALEPVFAMLFAVATNLEDFASRAALGAAIAFTGVAVSETGAILKRRLVTVFKQHN